MLHSVTYFNETAILLHCLKILIYFTRIFLGGEKDSICGWTQVVDQCLFALHC